MIDTLNKFPCENCGKILKPNNLFRLSWRYKDKENKYKSGRFIIHTGFKHLCIKCIKTLTK